MKKLTWNQWIVILCGSLTFVLGFLGLLGKQLHYLFVQIEPTYSTMVYDTSFCFCITGIGLFTTFFQYRYITYALAVILIIVSVLTGWEYILNVDWNIVQKLFFVLDKNGDYLNKTRPINAFSFLLVALLFWRMVKQKNISYPTMLMGSWTGMLLSAFAILSLFGYVIHTDSNYANGWGLLAPMSTNTAIGFILLGVGITSIVADFSQRIGMDLKRSLPIVATVFISLISLLFWRFLIIQENLRLSSDVVLVTISKELSIALLVGIAIYFLQSARYHAKNAECMFLLAKNAEHQLAHQATHDALTGLGNRTLFLDRIEQEIIHAKRQKNLIAVLFFDLDRFKSINDSLGHHIGDALLKAVADRLIKLTRQEDTLARLGGDEFVLLVLNVRNESNILVIVEKYHAVFSKAFYINDHELHLGCSIGVSLYPKDGTEADVLLKNADIAMYRAKENKQLFQFYTPEMQRQMMTRLSIENDLRCALEKNEFVLHYQPIVDLRRRKIYAVEALIRWKHPVRGLIYPDVFIPIVEEIGIIVPIGEWVLRAACAQNKVWQQNGLQITMHVNIAEKQIKHPNFYDRLICLLQEFSLNPQLLALELTENALMEDTTDIVKVLQQLRDRGISLSIDDFGMKYSSLSRLSYLPLDKLKIDKSFLKHVPENLNDRGIVLAIIAMAKNLNLRVIAEGVETKAQLDFLSANGCDDVQGYYFSSPLKASEFEVFLKSKEIRSETTDEFFQKCSSVAS